MTYTSRAARPRRWTIVAALAALAAPLAVGNHAYSGFHDAPIDVPNTLQTIATLDVPVAGSYVISAKLNAYNTSGVVPSTDDKCVLQAGGNFDTLKFDVDTPAPTTERPSRCRS
jgi:hypothetical protein